MEPIGVATSILGFGLGIKSYKDAKDAPRDDSHVLFAEMQGRYDELCIQLKKEERQLSAASTSQFSEATTTLAKEARDSAKTCLASGRVQPKYLRLGAWVVNYHCIKVVHLGDDGLAFIDALVAWVEQLVREKHVKRQLQYIRYSSAHHLLSVEAEAVFNAWFNAAKLSSKQFVRAERKNARRCKAVEDAVDAVRESIAILSKLFDTGRIGKEAAESVLKFGDHLMQAQFGRSEDLYRLHETLLDAAERPSLPGCLENLMSYLVSTKYPDDSENMRKEWKWFFDEDQDFKGAREFTHDEYFMNLELRCVTDGGIPIDNYMQLFEDSAGNAVRRILIYGEGGVGKTTYVHKLVNDWCRGRKANASESAQKLRERFSIVLLFRMNQHHGNKKLIDMLSQLDVSLHQWDVIERCLFDKNVQLKTLYIFDGVDEWLGGNGNDNNDILKIIAGELREATVIATSRPLSREERQSTFLEHRGIRICGLSDGEIEKNASALHPDMFAQLENDPSLKELVTNPLLFFMAAYVLKNNLVTFLNKEYKYGIEVFDVISEYIKYSAKRRNIMKFVLKTDSDKHLGAIWFALGHKFLQKHWSHKPSINELTRLHETNAEPLASSHQIGYISLKSETSPHRLIDDFFMAYYIIKKVQSTTMAANDDPTEVYKNVCAELYTEPVGMAVIYFGSAFDRTNQFANASLLVADKTRSLQGKELWGSLLNRPLPWLYKAKKLCVTADAASLWRGSKSELRFYGSHRSSDTILIQKITNAITDPMRVNLVHLSNVDVPVSGDCSFWKTLTRFKWLNDIVLFQCRLISDPKDNVKSPTSRNTLIAPFAPRLTHVTLLCLSYSNPQLVVDILNDLIPLEDLQYIYLVGMSDAIAAWLPVAILNVHSFKHLRKLKLREVALTTNGFYLLVEWLKQRLSLIDLTLIDIVIPDKFALTFFQFANQRLINLDIGGCSITAESTVSAFCDGMLGNKALKELSIATDSESSAAVCGSRLFWQRVVELDLELLIVNLDAIQAVHDATILHTVWQLQNDRKIVDSGVKQYEYRENRERKAISKVLSLLADDSNCSLPELSADWMNVLRYEGNMDMHEFTIKNLNNSAGADVRYIDWIAMVIKTESHKRAVGIRSRRIVIEGDAGVGKTALIRRTRWELLIRTATINMWHQILSGKYIATIHIKPEQIIEFGTIRQAVRHFIFDGINRVRILKRLTKIQFEEYAECLSENDLTILLEDSLILFDGFFDPTCKVELPQKAYEEIFGGMVTTMLITGRTGHCTELVRKLRNTENVVFEDHLSLVAMPNFVLDDCARAADNTNTHFDHSLLLLNQKHHPYIHCAVNELMGNSSTVHHKWEVFDVVSRFISKIVDHAIQKVKFSPIQRDGIEGLLCDLGSWGLQMEYPEMAEEFGCTEISDENLRLALEVGLINRKSGHPASDHFEMVSAFVASFCNATWLSKYGSNIEMQTILHAIDHYDRYFYSAMNGSIRQEILECHCFMNSRAYKRHIPWLYNVDGLTIPAELAKCWIGDGWMEFASSHKQMDCRFIEKVLAAADTRIQGIETVLLREILFTSELDLEKYHFRSIVALRMHSCVFTPNGSKHFSLLMRHSCRKLNKLVLVGCGRWICQPSEWFANFQDYSSLVELNFTETLLSKDRFVAELATSLNSAPTRFAQLKCLILANCGIEADGHLFTWLSHCQQLNVLSLEGLHFAESNGGELCKVVFQLKYLQVLNLLHCSLPDSFVDEFVQIDHANLPLTRFLFGKEKPDKTNGRSDFWKALSAINSIKTIYVAELETTTRDEQGQIGGQHKYVLFDITEMRKSEPLRCFDYNFCNGSFCGRSPIFDVVYTCSQCDFDLCHFCFIKSTDSHPHELKRVVSLADPVLTK